MTRNSEIKVHLCKLIYSYCIALHCKKSVNFWCARHLDFVSFRLHQAGFRSAECSCCCCVNIDASVNLNSPFTSSVGKPALQLSQRPPLMPAVCPLAACQPSCGLGCCCCCCCYYCCCCSGSVLLYQTAQLGCHWKSPFHQTSQNWTESP